MRNLRGWWYRRFLPSTNRACHSKRLSGFERRWNLETEGFTKEGFMRILKKKFLQDIQGGRWLELRTGDGLVGSLGVWLEFAGSGWVVEAWEDRSRPLAHLRISRPGTKVVAGRLTDWIQRKEVDPPAGITTRGVREASAVCRAIRGRAVRPRWVGIWNPSRRPVWAKRLEENGYRLQLAWHNMEFYRRKGL